MRGMYQRTTRWWVQTATATALAGPMSIRARPARISITTQAPRLQPADNERNVLPPEAEAVAQGVADPVLPRLVGHVVEVAVGVGRVVVDRRRQPAAPEHLDAGDQ